MNNHVQGALHIYKINTYIYYTDSGVPHKGKRRGRGDRYDIYIWTIRSARDKNTDYTQFSYMYTNSKNKYSISLTLSPLERMDQIEKFFFVGSVLVRESFRPKKNSFFHNYNVHIIIGRSPETPNSCEAARG